MFLHLSLDEKFIDSAHNAFERAAPGQHDFVIIDSTEPLKYIKTFEPRRLALHELLDPAFLETFLTYDSVILHSLNKPNRLAVDAAPKGVRFTWLGWGYDYYDLIHDPDSLLLPKTLALMQVIRSRAKFESIIALAKSAISSPRRILPGLRSRHIRSGGRDEYTIFKKIESFSPVLPTEDTLIRAKHPNFHPQYVSWNYGVHDIVGPPSTSITDHTHRVVVGNSATPECNHLDAFDNLADFDGEILVPLSYGNAAYRDAILQVGRQRFGDRFHPLINYMEVNTYGRLIAGSSHLLMNHLRQQGLTNILIALQAGTRVIMQCRNPLYTHLVKLGLNIDDLADGIDNTRLSKDEVARNQSIVSNTFGATSHHRRTCAFLTQIGGTSKAAWAD